MDPSLKVGWPLYSLGGAGNLGGAGKKRAFHAIGTWCPMDGFDLRLEVVMPTSALVRVVYYRHPKCIAEWLYIFCPMFHFFV